MKLSRKPLVAALIAAVLAPSALAGAALAAEPPATVDFEGSPLTYDGDDVWTPELVGMKYSDSLSIYVHLEGPSVFDVADAIATNRGLAGTDGIEKPTLVTVHREVVRRQAATVDALEGMGATVVGQIQVTLNAVHVNITRDQLADVVALPGVVRISRALEHTVAMDDTRPHIGATRAAEELGLDGTGTTVAIIDTGVDYMHAGLGGHGDTALRSADDNTILEEGTFPTEKVVGGYDFVGQAYNAGNPAAANPVPDVDPIDENGHGSHVSGITAGMPTTGAALNMHFGVAPEAKIVGLKVFGASGSTNVTIEAMDWVASHNLFLGEENEDVPGTRPDTKIDVINMSLGGGFGGGMFEYIAVTDRLIEQGVTTVASAGNSGAVPFVVGSPSATPKILSVANSFAPGEVGVLLTVNYDDQTDMHGGYEAANWTEQLATTGVVEAEMAWYGLACNGMDPAQEVNEKIALIERGTCAFYDKINNAATNGAIGVVVFSDNRTPTIMGCGAPSPCTTSPGIPGIMIDRGVGLGLQDMLEAGTSIDASIDGSQSYALDFLADVMNDGSSRGPGRGFTHIKPQITAPGSNIISTRNGSGNNGVRFSGTSMSGPAVAGVTALLWQRNNEQDLGLAGDDIAALAMNYSTPIIKRSSNNTGAMEGTTRQGAGIADAYASGKGMTLVRSHEGLAELSFGNTDVAGEAMDYERKLTVHNLSDADKTYALDYNFAFPEDDDASGVSLSFDAGDSLTVPAGDSAELTVMMNVDPTMALDWINYSGTPIADEGAFQYHEVDGYVHLMEVDAEGNEVAEGDMVGVPWHTLPRLRGCTTPDSVEPFMMGSDADDFETSWSNECGGTTIMKAYWHLAADELESMEADSGIPSELDISHVGVRYGTATLPNNQTVDAIEFAIATESESVLMYDRDIFIHLDADQDGTYDLVLFNVAGGAGAFYSVWAPEQGDTLDPVSDQAQWLIAGQGLFTKYDLHENVSALWIPVGALGETATLENGDLSFDFAVEIRDGQADYGAEEELTVGDMLPDNIDSGAHITFDQSLLDCLSLTDAEGNSLTTPLAEHELFANESVLGTVAYTCDAREGDAVDEIGILGQYINNIPGQASYSARPGMLMAAETGGTVYLPWLAHTFDAEAEEEPEDPGF